MQPNYATIRRDLAEAVYGYDLAASRLGLVGAQLMPFFDVPKPSGYFPKVDAAELLKSRETKRAAGGTYNRSPNFFSDDSFAAVEYGWEEPVDDSNAKNYASYFDAEADAAQIAQDVLLRGLEQRVAAVVEGLTPHAVTNKWSNYSAATPLKDVQTAMNAVEDATGVVPNVLQLTRTTFQNALLTDEVSGQIKYTQAYQTLPFDRKVQLLADYFGVERLVIARGVINGADEGQAFSSSGIWSNAKGCVMIVKNGSLRQVQLGRIMIWGQDSLGQGAVETYREEQSRSTIVRSRHWTAEKITTTAAAYSLSNLA